MTTTPPSTPLPPPPFPPPPNAPAHPRLSSGRRTLLALSAVPLLAVLVGGGLGLISAYGSTRITTNSEIGPIGQQVRVSTGSGDVVVHPSTDERIHLETRVQYGLRKPKLVQREGANGIELRADCWFADSQCQVNYDLRVPAGFDLVVTTGSGDIHTSDIAAPVQLTTGSGDILVERMSGRLELRTGSGDIRGRSIESTTVVARADSGDVNAEFTREPEDLQARTGSGDITLVVPRTTSYAVDLQAGSGDESVEVPTDPSSPRRILGRSGSGDVRVRAGR